MGLLSSTSLSVEVVLGGLSPPDGFAPEVTATVDFDRRSSDDTDRVAFLPMLVCAVLRGTRNAPEYAVPFAQACTLCCEAVVALDPSEDGGYRNQDAFAGAADIDPEDPEAQAAAMILVGVPVVQATPGPGPHRRLKASLQTARGSGFVKIGSANPLVAVLGVLAVLEALVRDTSSSRVGWKAAAATLLILDIAASFGPIPSREQVVTLDAVAREASQLQDPREYEQS